MPPADPRAAEMMRTIAAFESSVNAAENALVTRDWRQLDELLSTQHRLTAALANLMDETVDVRPQAFTDEIGRRITRIADQRADQLRRLVAFNHVVKERLTMISRVREIGRFSVAKTSAPRILNTLQ